MMNKIFGVKNITHLLYGFLICMPMLSILARTCYVAINKNAKDSYSTPYVQSVNKINTPTTLTEGLNYYLKYTDTEGGTGLKIHYSNINIDWTNYGASNQYTYTRFFISKSGSNTSIYLYETDSAPIQTLGNVWGYTLNEIYFTASTNNINNINNGPYNLYTITYQQQTLDNAFEYSLSQFTKDNNLGNVDIFSWFTNLFLDQTNPTNQLYLGFVNWYLNYTLLVSSGYLLFLTLIWFVNYVRRILDKSMNQEYGGF